MLTSKRANHILNLGLHALILFVFLSTFFFLYISKAEEHEVNKQTSRLVSKNTGTLLGVLDKWDKKLSGKGTINWTKVKATGERLMTEKDPKLESISKHNKMLKRTSIGIGIGIFAALVIASLIFKFGMKLNIHFGEIALENVIIFSIVGIIEYLFFRHIASQYVPVTPDVASSTIIARVKYHLDKSAEASGL